MMDKLKNIKKILLVTLSVAVFAIVTLLIADILKNARVNILVAPIDVEVKIDGKKVNGSTRFYPKEHVLVELSKEGFEKKEFYIDLKSNETVLIHDFLKHKTDGMGYYLKNKNDLELLKIIQNDETKDFFNKINKNSTIMRILPIKNSVSDNNGTVEYTEISNDASDKCVMCLKIQTNYGNNMEKIKNVFKKYGYNYDDFNITKIN